MHRGYVTAGRFTRSGAPRQGTRPTTASPLSARAMLDVAIPSASYAQDRLRDPSPLALIDRVTAAEEAALTTTQPERCRTA